MEEFGRGIGSHRAQQDHGIKLDPGRRLEQRKWGEVWRAPPFAGHPHTSCLPPPAPVGLCWVRGACLLGVRTLNASVLFQTGKSRPPPTAWKTFKGLKLLLGLRSG